MKFIGSYGAKSMTSEYQVVMGELSQMEEDEPEDEVLLPIPSSDLFYAKSAIDEVLANYEMRSSAVPDGIILHEAKLIGPALVQELKQAIVEVEKKALGATIGGAKPPAAGSGAAGDMIDRDGDGYIYDGTPQEQRVPYKRRDGKPVGGGAPSGMEARRRQFVRSEAERQGVSLNRERRAGGPGRSEQERRFRTEARARFDRIALEGQGFIPADRIEAGDKRNFENRMGDLNAPRRPDPRDGSFDRNEERRQRGLRQPDSWDENEQRRQEGMRPEDTSFQDNESRRQGAMRPGSRPVDRLRGAGGPGYDESFQDNESRRQSAMRPADTSFQDNESRRQGGMRPGSRPVDRLSGAGGPGYDESSNRAESSRMQGMRPADTSSQRAENARLGAARPQRPVDRLTGPGYDESSNRAESERMGRSRPQDTSSQRAESSRNNRSRPSGPADRMAGSGNRRADGSNNTAERNRMNRSRPADRSSQRNESNRQNRAASGTRNAQQRPPDRIDTGGNRSRRFGRGQSDYLYGGN